MTLRPNADEFNPFYSTYINLVPEGDLLSILEKQGQVTTNLLLNLTEQQASFKYGPSKWSIKEVIGHITDTERIMGYRLLSIARGEKKSLPGYDENMYVQNASFAHQTLKDLLEGFSAVRLSTLHLLNGIQPEDWLKRGKANDSEVSVRALAHIIAGHELHHRGILIERYLKAVEFPKHNN